MLHDACLPERMHSITKERDTTNLLSLVVLCYSEFCLYQARAVDFAKLRKAPVYDIWSRDTGRSCVRAPTLWLGFLVPASRCPNLHNRPLHSLAIDVTAFTIEHRRHPQRAQER